MTHTTTITLWGWSPLISNVILSSSYCPRTILSSLIVLIKAIIFTVIAMVATIVVIVTVSDVVTVIASTLIVAFPLSFETFSNFFIPCLNFLLHQTDDDDDVGLVGVEQGDTEQMVVGNYVVCN
ncbi:hypothetical protein Tco_1579206 [Tanacetum coccineum]